MVAGAREGPGLMSHVVRMDLHHVSREVRDMAGLEGVIQRLVEERDEKRAIAQEAMLDAKALDQAIEAIREDMKHRGQEARQDLSVMLGNPFLARSVGYAVYEVLSVAEEPLTKPEIHQRVSQYHSYTMNQISTALATHQPYFHHTDDGTWALVGT